MRRYLDTSLIVAALVREAGTENAKAYLSTAKDEILMTSRWAVTEVSSALALKVRTGGITEAEQAAALAMFQRFAAAKLRLVEIEPKDFTAAAGLCDQTAIPIRAGDALHLAACKRVGAKLATFDSGLASAAERHGVPCDFLTMR